MRCSLGQTWRNHACTGDATKYTWEAAKEAVASINRQGGFAGYTDWAVPHIQELASLMTCKKGFTTTQQIPAQGGFDIVIKSTCQQGQLNPSIDEKIFPNTQDYLYWSSSPHGHYADNAWSVYFGNGIVGDQDKNERYYVRPVRRRDAP